MMEIIFLSTVKRIARFNFLAGPFGLPGFDSKHNDSREHNPLENDLIHDSSLLFLILMLKLPAIKRSVVLVILSLFRSFIIFATSL